MNKNSIDENKAIQDGLERFLDYELGAPEEIPVSVPKSVPKPDKPVVKELKTEFATEVVRPKVQPKQTSYYVEEYEEDDFEDEDDFEEETFEEEVMRAVRGQRKQQKSVPKKSRKTERKQPRKKGHGQKAAGGKTKKKKSKWKKVLIILLLLLLALFVWWYVTIGKIYKEMSYEKTPGLTSEPMKQDGVTNVLLIGNDSRDNGEDGRSDAMILLSISNETETIHMTSLLRDMYVEIPGYDGNRLNAAYAYGGPALLCETIEQNFGIEVNRYVLVNFQAFASLVDAVGGVDLEVTNEEVQWINAYLNEYNLLEGREMTTDYLDASLSGEIHLNGPQALAYSRNRYIGTDFGRTERQRKVLNAVIKKLPIAFAANQNELIEELFPNLTTNLTQTEVFRLSMDAGKLLSYEILQMVIPAEGTYTNASIRGMSVLEVDFEANKAIIQKEIYGKE